MAVMQIGDRLAERWEVRKVLRGGQGEVYILYDHQERLTLAAKTPREDALRKEVAAKRFLQEARTWINLDDHPNIVRAYFVETLGGRPYLFLEYVSGGTLSDWIGTPHLTLERGLDLCIQFCRGMEHAYTRGMKVHRDIKPQNCLMTPDGVLKISDFGLVRILEQDDQGPGAGLTRVGSVLGTPMYLAPEQFLNSSGVDVRADIYSGGCMFYEIFAGQTPFKADPKDAKKWFQLHLYSPVPPINTGPGSGTPITAELNRIIAKCLSKVPDQRYADFAEARADFEALYLKLTGRPVAAQRADERLSMGDLCNKAFSLGELGRAGEEAAILEQVLDRDPADADEWIQRGAILARLGRADAAQTCFAQASLTHRAAGGRKLVAESAGKPRKALTIPPKLLAERPEQVEGLLHIARVFVETNRAQEALPYLEQILEARPDLADAWLWQGRALAELGRQEAGLAAVDKALSIEDGRADLWLQKGVVLMQVGRHPEARAAIETSLRLHETAPAWYQLGNVFIHLNQVPQALHCYETAERLDPQNADIWSHKGLALAKSGSFAEAMICFSEAERLGDNKASEAIEKMQALMSETDLDARMIQD
jgi:tetratricopeptide (TPR) repeat protein